MLVSVKLVADFSRGCECKRIVHLLFATAPAIISCPAIDSRTEKLALVGQFCYFLLGRRILPNLLLNSLPIPGIDPFLYPSLGEIACI